MNFYYSSTQITISSKNECFTNYIYYIESRKLNYFKTDEIIFSGNQSQSPANTLVVSVGMGKISDQK
ncbi:hypothetical protein B6I21_03895 [candidate division KSB1 bacterium 4572_119]|nr:MAG: hypothetical protein B6I21_03895 [candidate division KSB1 bacterium 4572_119]